jgi:hypothetical protein
MALTKFLKAKDVPAPHGPFLKPLEPEAKTYSTPELDLLKAQKPTKIEIRYVQIKISKTESVECFIIVGKKDDDAVVGATLPCPPICIPPPKETPEDFNISEAINYVLN